MDWTGYTPIYVRTGGSVSYNGLYPTFIGGTDGPKPSPASAYTVAKARVDNCVLDIGPGTFAGVILLAAWPVRIGVRGVSTSASTLASVTGNTYQINIVSDNTVTITNIINSSDDGDFGSQPGGTVILSSCNVGSIDTHSGSSQYEGTTGTGGTVTLTSSTAGAINASSGSAYYNSASNTGNGGTVTLINSTAGAINTTSGSAYNMGGSGGAVSLTSSTAGAIAALGGYSGYDNSGPGGAVTLTSSTAGNINTYSGNADGDSGSGGAVTLTSSTAGNINTYSDDAGSTSGNGGAVSLTGSKAGLIITRSGSCLYGVGAAGNVTLTNSQPTGINAVGGTSTYATPGATGTTTVVGNFSFTKGPWKTNLVLTNWKPPLSKITYLGTGIV